MTIAFNLAEIAARVPFVSVPGADASLRIDWIESLLSRPSMSGVVSAIVGRGSWRWGSWRGSVGVAIGSGAVGVFSGSGFGCTR